MTSDPTYSQRGRVLSCRVEADAFMTTPLEETVGFPAAAKPSHDDGNRVVTSLYRHRSGGCYALDLQRVNTSGGDRLSHEGKGYQSCFAPQNEQATVGMTDKRR